MNRILHILLACWLAFSLAPACVKDTPATNTEEQPETPEQPENPDLPDTPGGTDNPDTPEEPENPDTPENPDIPDTPDIPNTPEEPEMLDPGKAPSEQTYRPGRPDLVHTVAYSDFYSPGQDYLDEFGNVDYVCSKGNGTAWPIITDQMYIRLYQGTSAKDGGSYIRFRSKYGASLQNIRVSTATPTRIAWYRDGRPSTKGATQDFMPGDTLSLDLPAGCTEICFICMGTSQSERWELNYVSLTYKGGFVEEDFFHPAEEYGPLMKVPFPFTEDFEKGFPTTDKPTYYKYGLTAGRDNLQWSTWFGSFSWQKPIGGAQSAQLRVYQEDSDYDQSQFGYLKMEYFIKDLSKVTFKYYMSHFWNKAIVYYCEFGESEYKGAQQVFLTSYSERQTVREFEYVLDGGVKHDAKIIIEIDPATGQPGSDHYDFYFDDFVFE